jgi:hypothetical protein
VTRVDEIIELSPPVITTGDVSELIYLFFHLTAARLRINISHIYLLSILNIYLIYIFIQLNCGSTSTTSGTIQGLQHG